jgi:hypothetical protein
MQDAGCKIVLGLEVGSCFAASQLRRDESGIWHLASGIWYLASGIWYLGSSRFRELPIIAP